MTPEQLQHVKEEAAVEEIDEHTFGPGEAKSAFTAMIRKAKEG